MNDLAENFWSWFAGNNKPYLALNELDDNKKQHLLDTLELHLHKYCDHLFFQIGGFPGEEQELIITSEGDIEYFAEVEKLIAFAPTIQHWNFVAFIQPSDDLGKVEFEDIILKPRETWFMPLNSSQNPNGIGIRICLPDYEKLKGSKWLDSAVFKMLDVILGEKTFAIDISYIDIGELPDEPEKQGMIELSELLAYINWKKRKLDKQI